MHKTAELQSQWAIMEVLCALETSGVFAVMNTSFHSLPADAIAQRAGVDVKKTTTCLDFLSVHFSELISYNNNMTYSLKPLYRTRGFQNSLYFSIAYKPVMNQIDVVLQSAGVEKAPERDHDALGESSSLFTKNLVPEIVAAIQKYNVDTVIDLGCGNGSLLNDIQAMTKLQCIGVDLKPPRSDKNINFVAGDIQSPEQWMKKVDAKNVVLVSCFAMHEFFGQKGEGLQLVLDKYSKLFSGSHLIMSEYDAPSWETLRLVSDSELHGTAFYKLVHPLTNQDNPVSRSEWVDFFSRSPQRLVSEFSTQVKAVVYDIEL